MTRKTEMGTDAGTRSVDDIVMAAQAIIEQGKPKIEAAMHIYLALLGRSQDDVVSAFIAGASLTPKGAVTYWYNCKRKHSRMRSPD